MSEDEIVVFIISGIGALAGAYWTKVSSLPRAFTQGNAGIGLLRLSVAASVLWAAYVMRFHGDPSIQGVYVWFYLLMAYAVVKIFGQISTLIFGLHLRSDVYERRNLAAALFIAGFTFAVGVIFGGSLWGEADPLSENEGGYWIPLAFFALGWAVLVISTALYLWREPGKFQRQIRQERETGTGWGAGVYMVMTATLIFRGVAGDFWGWQHGILGMGTIALMLVGHECILLAGARMSNNHMARMIESIIYILLGAAAWQLNQLVDRFYTGVP